jgi:hypothetical protein
MGIKAATCYNLCLYTDSTKGPENETKCEKYETSMSHSTQYGVLKTNVKNQHILQFLGVTQQRKDELGFNIKKVVMTDNNKQIGHKKTLRIEITNKMQPCSRIYYSIVS